MVFINEKPMKDTYVYDLVRRDPVTVIIPHNVGNVSSKNVWNILFAVTINKGCDFCGVFSF